MPIYTKTGDKGTTSLFDGTRVSKDDPRVDTYGSVDELNSQLGVVLAYLQDTPYEESLKGDLLQIQKDLLTIGSILADPQGKVDKKLVLHLDTQVKHFEKRIDEMTSQMPELSNFILPGGGKPGALLHMARTVTRRVERKITSLVKKESVEMVIVRYFNRLSDLLFTMSRYINFKEGNPETIWNRETE